MRRVLVVCGLVASLGCAAPRSSGALWALEEARLEEETVYRTPQPQREAQARQYELLATDDLLAADQARLEGLLAGCPGPRQDRLEPSAGAKLRDAARSKQDPDRRARADRLAAADWYLRRAATTGDASFCERARQSLDQSVEPERTGRVQALPDGEVDQGTASPEAIDASADPYLALVAYRLGLADAVRGPAPLVGHLAAIYGGSLKLPAVESAAPEPEDRVDRLAASLEWEPDGLDAALRALRQ
jgi:hypothetical protein